MTGQNKTNLEILRKCATEMAAASEQLRMLLTFFTNCVDDMVADRELRPLPPPSSAAPLKAAALAVKKKAAPRRRTPPDDATIREMWALGRQGVGDAEIGRRFGVSSAVVNTALSRVAPDGRVMKTAHGDMDKHAWKMPRYSFGLDDPDAVAPVRRK